MANSDLSFDGRVVVVTGGGRGLGRAYAQLLGRLGAKLVINDLGGGVEPGSAGSTGPASDVVDELRSAGVDAVADFTDIARPGEARRPVDLAIATFGRVDAVINNAGTSVHKRFQDVTPGDLDAMLQLHIGGHFHVTQAAWSHFIGQGYGRVVMTTSGSGLFGSSNNHHYAAAKGGIAGLTRSLAIDGARHGIAVNAVAPLAATRMVANLSDEALRRDFTEHLRPDQVAPLVAWLVHARCRVNGEIFEVGGGLAARIVTAEGVGHLDPAADIAAIDASLPAIMAETGAALPRSAEETAIKLLARLGIGPPSG